MNWTLFLAALEATAKALQGVISMYGTPRGVHVSDEDVKRARALLSLCQQGKNAIGNLSAKSSGDPGEAAIDWSALLNTLLPIFLQLLPLIITLLKPAPTPTPSLPGGSGNASGPHPHPDHEVLARETAAAAAQALLDAMTHLHAAHEDKVSSS